MFEDEQHLDTLAVFHYVFGGVVAFGVSLFLVPMLLFVAAAMSAMAASDETNFFSALLPLCSMLVIPGIPVLVGLIFAAMIIIAGRKLRARQSRTFCLVIAALESFCFPLGTILGMFTIAVLMRERVRNLFGEW